MDSSSDTTEKKEVRHNVHHANAREVDVAAQLDSDAPLDPAVALRLRCVNAFYVSATAMFNAKTGVKSTGISCPSCVVSTFSQAAPTNP